MMNTIDHRNILLVEDEPNLGETLSEYLSSLDFNVDWAKTAKEARDHFSSRAPSIILMDIGLPDGDGIELAQEFRNQNKNLTLLFLSAQNDPETRLHGLEIGADDYITKPFALKELVLRLNRTLDSASSKAARPDEINHGPLKIWFQRFEVQDAEGQILNLSQKECEILEMLYEKRGEAVPREEIIEKVWGADRFPSNRTVDNYIVKLRRWCETDSAEHISIQSIRSVGYKLNIKE
jgi:two-component system alkaline phosphatase synthesis response regulator PhoP